MVFYCCCRCGNRRDDLGVGKVPADCCRSCIDICPLRRGEKEIESGCFLQHYAGNIFLFFLLLLLMYFLLGMAVWDISMSMTCGQQCFLSAQALVTATPLVLFSIGANDLPLNVSRVLPVYFSVHHFASGGYSFSANLLPVHRCLLFLLSGQLLRSLRLRTGGKGSFLEKRGISAL